MNRIIQAFTTAHCARTGIDELLITLSVLAVIALISLSVIWALRERR